MDKLADGLQRLGEDDLLQVVQMVHDHKAPDSYTKNDTERRCPATTTTTTSGPRVLSEEDRRRLMEIIEGEFHVDLYTLPDSLIKMLWDFTQEKGAIWLLRWDVDIMGEEKRIRTNEQTKNE